MWYLELERGPGWRRSPDCQGLKSHGMHSWGYTSLLKCNKTVPRWYTYRTACSSTCVTFPTTPCTTMWSWDSNSPSSATIQLRSISTPRATGLWQSHLCCLFLGLHRPTGWLPPHSGCHYYCATISLEFKGQKISNIHWAPQQSWQEHVCTNMAVYTHEHLNLWCGPTMVGHIHERYWSDRWDRCHHCV